VQFRGIEKGRGFEFKGEDSAFLPSSTEIHHGEGTGTSTAQTIDTIGLLLLKKKKQRIQEGKK